MKVYCPRRREKIEKEEYCFSREENDPVLGICKRKAPKWY